MSSWATIKGLGHLHDTTEETEELEGKILCGQCLLKPPTDQWFPTCSEMCFCAMWNGRLQPKTLNRVVDELKGKHSPRWKFW